MAVLVRVNVDDAAITAFGRRYRASKEKQIKRALGEIKREWHAEIVRQFDTFPSTRWHPLKTKPRNYQKEKERDFNNPKKPEVKYNTILKRTGRMFDGYLRGIRIDEVNFRVIIPFPRAAGGDKKINVRAKVHQGALLPPPGLRPRPLDNERFSAIASEIINAAVRKDSKNR